MSKKPTFQGALPQILVPDKLHLPTMNSGHFTVISGKTGRIFRGPEQRIAETRPGQDTNHLAQEPGRDSHFWTDRHGAAAPEYVQLFITVPNLRPLMGKGPKVKTNTGPHNGTPIFFWGAPSFIN